jgi:hypothetical protein
MRRVVLFVLVLICWSWANGQTQTQADPFGLTAFGFGQKLETRPIIVPSREPPQSHVCARGIYLREEAVTVNNKTKKVKVVIVYFLPNPSTLSMFDLDEKNKLKPLAQPLTGFPPQGVSSLTFFWPPQLRSEQQVLFMRAEKVNDIAIQRALKLPAQLDVREGDSPSILWKLDSYIPGVRSPEIVGNLVASEPVQLKVFFPRGTKKCIEGK